MSHENGHRDRVNFNAHVPTRDAIAQLEEIIACLKSGTLHVRHGEESVALEPGDYVDIDVKARQKKGHESLKIRLEWERPTHKNGKLRVSDEIPPEREEGAEEEVVAAETTTKSEGKSDKG